MKLKIDKWDILMIGGPWLLVVIAIIAGIIIIIASVGILSQENNTSNTPSSYSGTGEMTFTANVMTAKQIYNYIVKTNPEYAQDYQQIYDACQKFNMNPSFILAIASTESSLGTAGWGKINKNPGNLGHRGDFYSPSGVTGHTGAGNGRFDAFNTFGDGTVAIAWHLRVNYIDGGGGWGKLDTMEKVFNTYSPPGDGDNQAPEKRSAEVRNKMREIEATPKN